MGGQDDSHSPWGRWTDGNILPTPSSTFAPARSGDFNRPHGANLPWDSSAEERSRAGAKTGRKGFPEEAALKQALKNEPGQGERDGVRRR